MTDRVFTALVLLSLVAVLAAVALDIYQHPADPRVVGTAAVEVSGTGRFEGTVGAGWGEYAVKGTAPLSIEVPYRRADSVSVYVHPDGGSAVTARIRVGCRTVDKGKGHVLIWKVPRSWKEGLPPEGWSRCTHRAGLLPRGCYELD